MKKPTSLDAAVDRLKSAAAEFRNAENALGEFIEAEYDIPWAEIDVDTGPWDLEFADLKGEIERELKICALNKEKDEIERRVSLIVGEISAIQSRKI